ncbi:hypothetical protein NOR_03551 [Metarhizium rileyi]|uniref:Uncharacterized protein n=1 Tax=Metarhizium rileyi (strain RCEF 4871) TaxID=1649241 RepID=A0A167F4U9_METRR|nr:hypothetical protein NOR_03551 [Metarhizium rileyi RCEF 4871]
MPAKKKKGPSKSILFCEYIVGTTISSALGPIPKKPSKKRDVVTVEVVTDDETEEDTVKITYPRSGKSAKSQAATAGTVKKVRFEEEPKKSALKKAASSESEETTADSETDASAESSGPKADETPSPPKVKTKKSKEKQKEATKPSDSEDDSEPHPTCECISCVRGRQKPQRQAEKASKTINKSESDKNVTTDEVIQKKGLKNGKTKGKGKERAKMDSPPGEAQEESAKDTDDSDHEKKKDTPQQEKKNKNKNKIKDSNIIEEKNKIDDELKSKEQEPKPDKSQKEATEKKPSPKEKLPERRRENNYPAPYPGPHPRRPNLIAPMRAEVVHTERVVETPEDPIPNAYYDAENNIIRIYHGPVYGHHHQSLYPKRDPSLRPLPIGMPHPTQNPYYHGFDKGQETTGMGHVPITQPMAMPAWNAFAPVSFPGYPGAFAPGPWPGMEPATQNQNQNRGAFSMVNPAAAPASSENQDVAGGNNVFPPGASNPYLPKKTKSQFSGFGGSNASLQHASPKDSGAGRSDKENQPGEPQHSGWGNGNSNGNGNDDSGSNKNGNGGDASGWGNQAQENTWDSNNSAGDNQASNWNSSENNSGNEKNNSGGSYWAAEGQPPAGDGSWANQDAQNTSNDTSSAWPAPAEENNAAPAAEHNNVMPGAWSAPVQEIPPWGDTSMAASTGGTVDKW